MTEASPASTPPPTSPPGRNVDLLVAGVVRVRLEDAGPADVAMVERQLGPVRTASGGEPDVVIRFVDRLVTSGTERRLGLDEAAWSSDAFIILRSRHKRRARVALDLAAEVTSITCERGLPAVPHLVALVNLAALRHDVVAAHASAFVHDGRGVLVTGWSKGGKTETLLAFAEAGARVVGDEWIHIRPDGRMAGLPEPIRLWDWQLRQLPEIASRVTRGDRARLAATRAAAGALGLGARGPLGRTKVGRTATRIEAVARRQLDVQVPPERLFGRDRLVPEATLDAILFVAAHDDPAFTTRPVPAAEVAARLAASLQFERRDLLAVYQQFRFAFPDRRNARLEGAEATERRLLAAAFADRPAVEIDHPHPFEIARLHEAARPFLDGLGAPSAGAPEQH